MSKVETQNGARQKWNEWQMGAKGEGVLINEEIEPSSTSAGQKMQARDTSTADSFSNATRMAVVQGVLRTYYELVHT